MTTHEAFDPDDARDALDTGRRTPRPMLGRVLRALVGSALAVGAFLVLAPASVKAQFGLDLAPILLKILTQNVEINGKLKTNNDLTKGYWDWHRDDLAAGYRRVLPKIDPKLVKIFRDADVGYVEGELARIEAMTRNGRIDEVNRDDFEHAFSKIPDTPDSLGQLAVDANTVYLMTKAGQIHKKIDEYRREFEALAQEQQVSPYRAEQIAKQQDLLRIKIQASQTQLLSIQATNDAMQTAMANKFLKDEKASQLQNAEEMRRWMRSAKPPWMTDGEQSGAPPY